MTERFHPYRLPSVQISVLAITVPVDVLLSISLAAIRDYLPALSVKYFITNNVVNATPPGCLSVIS